jgi:uncharacterized membrane protein
MHTHTKILLIFFLTLLVVLPLSFTAQAKDPVVRVVLFFSQTCPHCQLVITQALPPLKQTYGDQLEIFGVNVGLPEGQTLYQNAVAYFKVPDDRIVVPMMIVADNVLIGSAEIPEKLPGIIDEGLKNGGIDWPLIPGLDEALSQIEGFERELTMAEKFQQDLAGNSLSVIVLLGMIASVVVAGFSLSGTVSEDRWSWAIPVLSILGIVVASYLAFVEVTETEAVCGPVGDCNAVQQSQYAILFGVLPIGILGLTGYIAILVGWLIHKYGPETWRKISSLLVWAMAGFGVLFSIYLTFLEPFVIGATCAWCLTSAVIITLQLLAATPAFKQALFKNDLITSEAV